MDARVIKVRLSGSGVRPETVPLSDLRDMLEALERTLESGSRGVADQSDEQEITGLVAVESSSASYAVSTSLVTANRFDEIIVPALKERNLSSLPMRNAEGVRGIQEVARRHKAQVVWLMANGSESEAVSFGYDDDFAMPERSTVKGVTTVYGFLERVGGATPRAALKLSTSQILRFDVTREFAEELAPHLYRFVRIAGTADWNGLTWEIEDFIPQELLEFREEGTAHGFRAVAEISGDAWLDIDDVESAILDIRAGGDPWR